jgi:di/tricarboxylate transporter
VTLVFLILAVTIALFISDWLRLDLVALLALLALTLTGILEPAEALAGFADPVVIMIASLFVVGGGLFRTGVADRIGHSLSGLAGTSRVRLTAVIMLVAGTLSAVLSSTGTVAVLLPVTIGLAWKARISPSLLLIPLAFGALLGGLLTLVGTPPNLVVSNQLAASGYAPFHFLAFAPVGAVMLGAGCLFMVLLGSRLLTPRAAADGPAQPDEVELLPRADLVRAYAVGDLVRLRVTAASPLVGITAVTAGLRSRYDANVVGIVRRARSGVAYRVGRTAEEPLRAGDELDLQVGPDAVPRLIAELQLEQVDEPTHPETRLAEVLLPPRSRLIGQSIADLRFRDRYGVNVLSIRRGGGEPAGPLANTQMRFGDTLLVAGSRRRIAMLRNEPGDFLVVAREEEELDRPPARLSGRGITALLIMLAMMALLTFNIVPAVIAVLVAAVAMVLAGAINMDDAYRSISWPSVVLIAAMLPMATALQKTGGMDLVIQQLGHVGAFGPLATLAALFLITSVLSQVISNTATAVLLAPIALGSAVALGVSPYPMMMAVAVAASSAFATPIATPVNTLVLGPGAYRFGDFFRAGALLQLIIFALALLVIPLLFPF